MLYTIGYRKKSAEEFFEKLKEYNVKNIIDVRLKNTSHLAGFAKKKHLIYFLKEICNINYYHYEFLAPSNDILKDYKNSDIDWNEYEKRYNNLLKKRDVMKDINCRNKNKLLKSSDLPDDFKDFLRLIPGYDAEFDDYMLRVSGYGFPDIERALSSSENKVTLYAENSIEIDNFDIYEIPIPDDFIKESGLYLPIFVE